MKPNQEMRENEIRIHRSTDNVPCNAKNTEKGGIVPKNKENALLRNVMTHIRDACVRGSATRRRLQVLRRNTTL
jgi:hypothetical protein